MTKTAQALQEIRGKNNRIDIGLQTFSDNIHYDSYSVRIVNICNSLPASVISENYVNTFKSRLNRFWANQ